MSVSHQIRRCTTFLVNNYTENSDPIYKEWWRVQISRFDLALYSLSDENALGRVSIHRRIGFFSRVELNKKKWERTTESKLRKVDTLLIHAIGYHPTESLGHKASCVILPQNFWLPCLCKYCEVFPQALVFSIELYFYEVQCPVGFCWWILIYCHLLISHLLIFEKAMNDKSNIYIFFNLIYLNFLLLLYLSESLSILV